MARAMCTPVIVSGAAPKTFDMRTRTRLPPIDVRTSWRSVAFSSAAASFASTGICALAQLLTHFAGAAIRLGRRCRERRAGDKRDDGSEERVQVEPRSLPHHASDLTLLSRKRMLALTTEECMAKIERARVVVTSPGRNFVTLVIETSDGVRGVGDATLNGRELAVAAYLQDHVVPCLIGRDPHRIEDVWQFLYRGAYWRRGPVTMSAIAAVDVALWDIKGKIAGLPLYQLLGGASRDSVMVYGHANGRLDRGNGGARARISRARLPGDPPAERNSRPGVDLWRVQRQIFLRAGRCRPSDGKFVVDRKIHAHRPRAVRRCARGARARRASAARRPPSAHPDRSCAAREGPGAVPLVLAGGRGRRRQSGKLPPRFGSTRRRRSR